MASGSCFVLNCGCVGRHAGAGVENIGVAGTGLGDSDAPRVIPDALRRFSDALKAVCDGLGLARAIVEVEATVIYSRVICPRVI